MLRDTMPDVTIRSIDEHMPYERQVGIFAQADIVVSVHGSQLVNQIFMRKGAGLLEMLPHSYYHNEQKRLSAHTHIDHVELVGNARPPREAVSEAWNPSGTQARTLSDAFRARKGAWPRCRASESCWSFVFSMF